MKKSLLLTAFLTLTAVFGAKAADWQQSFKSESMKNKGVYSSFTTPVYELDEPADKIRLTVFATKNTDMNSGTRASGYSNNSSCFPTFAISELRIYDGDGNQIEITEDMLETNALSLDEGALAYLLDGDFTTHFHSTYTNGEVPQAYHYIEVTLQEPVSKFSLQYDSRYYYYFTDPTYVAVTLGTEALPYIEDEFSLGDQVTSLDEIKPNTLYAIRGNYFEFTRTENQRTLPSYGEAFYHSPYGAALTPSAASVMWLEDNGDGKYYMHWLKNDHYIAAGGEVEAGAYVGWDDNVANAAALEFFACDSVDGAFEIKSGNLYLGQRRFVRMSWVNDGNMAAETSTYNYAWNVYGIEIKNTALLPLLQASIDRADELMALQGVASEDNGEYEALGNAVAEAKNTVAAMTASANEMLEENAKLTSLTNDYRLTYIYVLSDSISAILDNDDIVFCDAESGWEAGGYPAMYQEKLQSAMDKAGEIADNPSNTVVVENCITELCTLLSDFYASKVDKVSEYPIHIAEKDIAYTIDNNNWLWTSPLYYLAEATDVIRMTVFETSCRGAELTNGVPFFALGELEIYDAAGNKIEIREDMLSTNSIQTGDGGGLAALCDGDYGTHYHGCYAINEANGSYAPVEGEYPYIQIALDEPISAFSYGYVSRRNSSDYYKHAPLDLAFSNGTQLTYEDVHPVEGDKYNAVLGNKITDVSQIVLGEPYALWGNLDRLDTARVVVGNGSGFYNGCVVYGEEIHSCCVVVFEDAGDGKYNVRNVATNSYIKVPTYWTSATSTYLQSEAVDFTVINSTNIEEAFKFYYTGPVTEPGKTLYGEGDVYYMMQDWADHIGMYTIADLADDDEDGESDWFIYEVELDNFNKMDLIGAMTAVESFGIDYTAVGDAVGMLSSKTVEPVQETYAKAEATVDSGDEVACKAVAEELRTVLASIPDIETVPLVSGQNYVIRSSNPELLNYHGEDVKFSMYVGPKNGTGARDADNMVWWTYEYVDGLDSTAYHFTFVEDTTTYEEQKDWAKYTIKNVLYDEYIVPETGGGKNLTTSADEAALIYLRPYFNGNIGHYELIGFNDVGDNYSYFETRTGGGGYGTGPSAHYGRVGTWYYTANTVKWQLIPVSATTSINNLVIDEPEGDVVSVSYYTPAGMASNVPVKGVNIVKMVYANGVVESKKIFVK